jgi:hypothetical protein
MLMRQECNGRTLRCQAFFRGGLCKKRTPARGQKTKKAKTTTRSLNNNNNNNNKKSNEDKDEDDKKGQATTTTKTTTRANMVPRPNFEEPRTPPPRGIKKGNFWTCKGNIKGFPGKRECTSNARG